jgi:hypothetical protein
VSITIARTRFGISKYHRVCHGDVPNIIGDVKMYELRLITQHSLVRVAAQSPYISINDKMIDV